MDFEERLSAIENYRKENEGCDPNIYELLDVIQEFNTYITEKAPNYGIYEYPDLYLKYMDGSNTKLYDVINKYSHIVSESLDKLVNNDLNITKDSPLYKLVEDNYNSSKRYSAQSSIELMKKLGGVNLYLSQQDRSKRNGEIDKVEYANRDEFGKIKELYSEYTKGIANYKIGDKNDNVQCLYENVYSEWEKTIGVRGTTEFIDAERYVNKDHDDTER